MKKVKIYRPKYCECAAHCGLEVKPGRRFIRGHKGSWNKGKRTKKSNLKRSKTLKELWQDPEWRKRTIEARNKPEAKEKLSKTKKLQWQDPEFAKMMWESLNKPEVKEKKSKTAKATNALPTSKAKRSKSAINACARPEVKKNRGKAQVIAQNLPDTVEKRSKSIKVSQTKLWLDPEYKAMMWEAQNRPEVKMEKAASAKITNALPEVKKKRSESAKKMWQDPEHAKKMWEAFAILPNKPETFLINFLDNFYPNEWKYTGNFSFIVGGKSPDFVNEERKLIIEHYGTYWHRNDNPQDRIDIFTPFGYRTLIIWEHELKDFKTLRRKIFNFVENGI